MTTASCTELLKSRLSEENYQKLAALDNAKLHKFVAEAIELTTPDSVFVCTDSQDDIDYIREMATKTGAEKPLAKAGHTYHFDGAGDQARDKGNTKYLLAKGVDLGERINSTDKEAGTAEVKELMKGQMAGKQMLVCFFCLGPTGSEFSIPCVQITDSAYVGHSEFILYRPGYEQFKSIGDSPDFFRFMHSEGETTEAGTSKNTDKRRMYIDLADNIVYSVNTQYAGNTVGLKKLALRLAIHKADKEGWLAEHMFIMGVHGPSGRITYFAGAFPSACGKTSTAMIPGQTIIGDDIAYFKKINGEIRTANVERGIFGIIRDVNAEDDPVIYEALNTPGEVIFSNVLINDGKPYWLGMGSEIPAAGVNYSGDWTKGKTDAKGNEITPSHKNARYTVSIGALTNRDPMADVPVGGVVYGGRDSDTCVPVEQAFSWAEGIIAKGASLESETTAATLGAEGVRTFNLMSNLDFLAIPLGRYILNNLNFVDGVEKPPAVFSVNYFLKEDGKYLNGMADKKVWMLWAELRANGDVEAIQTPTGFIPKYEDLAKLFKDNLGVEYTQADYVKQFTIRIPQLLAKYDRIENIYKTQVDDTPQIVFDTFADIKKRLNEAKDKYGEQISPFDLEAK